MDTAWIALIGTLLGGAGLKIVEAILARSSKRVDFATSMREELRSESKTLRDELRIAEKDLDSWKEKYFLLLQEYLEIKSEAGHTKDKNEKKQTDW